MTSRHDSLAGWIHDTVARSSWLVWQGEVGREKKMARERKVKKSFCLRDRTSQMAVE